MPLWITVAAYAFSGGVALIAMVRRQKIGGWLTYIPALLGWLAHSLDLGLEIAVTGMLQMSLLNSISICVWMSVAVIAISALSKPLNNLFPFLMPTSALLLLLALLLPQLASPRPYATGMLVHIFVSLLAYSVMFIATLQAILVHIQSAQLHQHRVHNRLAAILPPLQSMERLMFEWLIVGFILLTAAMVTGGLYVENLLAQQLIHKTVLTAFSWVFFATLIFGHLFLGWRGENASRLIYLGFSCLLIGFVGSKFVLEYLLRVQ